MYTKCKRETITNAEEKTQQPMPRVAQHRLARHPAAPQQTGG